MAHNESKKSFDLTDSIISGIDSLSEKSSEYDKSSSEKSLTTSSDKSSSVCDKLNLSEHDDCSHSSTKSTSSCNKSSNNSSSDKSSNGSSSDKSSNSSSSDKLSNNSSSCDKSSLDKSSSEKSSFNSSSSDKSSSNTYDKVILPAHADPYIYDRKTKQIRYNFERCIPEETPVIFGGHNGNIIFDPNKSSIVSGKGNLSELPNSVIFGTNNKNKLEVKGDNKHHIKYGNNTIFSGNNNELVNCSNTSLLGCSNVKLKRAENVTAMGINATKEDEFPENMKETTLFRNVQIAGNLSANNISHNSLYIPGNSQQDVYHNITRGDGVNIIYANPIDGPIHIQLGLPSDMKFEANRTITIKDVTLEFDELSNNNVSIFVPPAQSGVQQSRIEYYDNNFLRVSSDPLMGYVINTSGGSVTFQYVESLIPGFSPVWVIQSQFQGNSRTLPFPRTDIETRSRLLRNK